MYQHTNIYDNPNKQLNTSSVYAVHFFPTGSEENKRNGNVRLDNKELFRGNIPVKGGAYDMRMGVTERNQICGICENDKMRCPGHSGYVDLKYPVKSPMFRDELHKWLKICCFECGNVIIEKKIKATRRQIMSEYVKHCRNIHICANCGADHPHIARDKYKTVQFYKEHKDEAGNIKREVFYNHQIKNAVDRIPDEVVLQMKKPLSAHPRKFILNILLASPNTIRPDIRKTGSGRSNNNDITTLLKNIIAINETLPAQIPELPKQDDDDRDSDSLPRKYYTLDQQVYDMIKGSSIGSVALKTTSSNNKGLVSLSQRLPKKMGRFRRNILGKRVMNTARSVITGDPFMSLNEVGVPLQVAKIIQIPEYVQEYNIKKLNVIYMNRHDIYPGWTSIIKSIDGRKYNVSKMPRDYKLQIGDIIYRDMIDGDPVCFGRQPSLLPSNLAGLSARILGGAKTLRMNVSICNLYNADFDGDTMLLSVPTNLAPRYELKKTSFVHNFIISWKDSSCSLGVFQDSLIGAAQFTRNNVKLNKWHAMQAFANINTTTERQITFDKKMYTSRELISMILPNIHMKGKPKIYKKEYAPYINYHPEDINVNIEGGKLIQGILDKKLVGQGITQSLFHLINNEYGPAKTMEVIYAIQQCTSNFQMYKGFTVSIKDTNISDSALLKIKENKAKIIDDSRRITEKYNNRKLYAPVGRTLESFYEELQMKSLEPGDDFVIPVLEDIDFTSNGKVQLVFTGSKGKETNVIAINASLGLRDVNGRRVPKTFGWKRTSPCYTRYDTEPDANGYISQSYKEGMSPESFIFAAQEARHSLINNALSTSVAGEQSRHAIKNLESLVVGYVRELKRDNNIVQMIYSGTGFDPRKIISVKFPTVSIGDSKFIKNYKTKLTDIQSKYRNKQMEEILDAEFKQLINDRNEYRRIYMSVEKCDFSYLFTDKWKSPVDVQKILIDVTRDYKDYTGVNLNPKSAIDSIKVLCATLPYAYMNSFKEKTEARIPEHYRMATSVLNILIRSILCVKSLIKHKITDDLLDIILTNIKITFMKSLIDYGFAMGFIAAQCISEPMTQFVLDSKHRSGIGGGTKTNVITRVKEIVGAKDTDKMKNPTMTLRVLPELETNKAVVQEIANKIEMLTFKKFLSKIYLFDEKYGHPIHPEFKDEKILIENFENRHRGMKIPGDLLNYCIRFELNKEEMIFKSMSLDTIVMSLRQKFRELLIVFTPENSHVLILRCYVRASLLKKSTTKKTKEEEVLFMIKYIQKLKHTVIRGITNIKSAGVVEYVRSETDEDNKIYNTKIYGIETAGSNLDEILKVEGLDLNRCITDSILEMTELLGIEAGRDSVINELRTTLEGISEIHCTVYADEMCYPGKVTSIQRIGMSIRERDNILLRACFQYPVQTLEEAAKDSIINKIYGVSAPLSMGIPPKIGTTYSDIIVNQDFIKTHNKTLDEKIHDL